MPDLVLLSGGLDSSTLLADRVARGTAKLTLSVDYGQRHGKELAAAQSVAEHYGVRHFALDLRGWGRLLKGSALTDPGVEVPHGHYADESMKTTIVPNRNATMLMAACGVAISHGCDRVLTAVHAGDHPIYPDCRPAFIDAANDAVAMGTDYAVSIEAPFVMWTKTDIARHADKLAVPLDLTWSCYEGREVHCGQCGTCVERIEAMREARVTDPTRYRAAA